MNEFIIGNTYISTNVTEAVERYGKDINKLLFNKYTVIKRTPKMIIFEVLDCAWL